MPRLRQNEKERGVGMLRAGMTQTQIVNHFNVSRMTIYRLMIPLRIRAIRQTVHVVENRV
jgi:transposase